MNKGRISPLFIVFLALMALVLAFGVFLLIYGALHNGPAQPGLPGMRIAAGGLHG